MTRRLLQVHSRGSSQHRRRPPMPLRPNSSPGLPLLHSLNPIPPHTSDHEERTCQSLERPAVPEPQGPDPERCCRASRPADLGVVPSDAAGPRVGSQSANRGAVLQAAPVRLARHRREQRPGAQWPDRKPQRTRRLPSAEGAAAGRRAVGISCLSPIPNARLWAACPTACACWVSASSSAAACRAASGLPCGASGSCSASSSTAAVGTACPRRMGRLIDHRSPTDRPPAAAGGHSI